MNGLFDRRGANIVVIDPNAGEVTSRKSYDIWGDPNTINSMLVSDLRDIPQGHIVLVACKDSGFENLSPDSINALRSVGATVAGPLKMREGYALVGVKGGPAWAESSGPSCEVEWDIPCAVEFPPPPPPLPKALQDAERQAAMGGPPGGMPGAGMPGGMPPFPGQGAPQPGGFPSPAAPRPRPPSSPPPIDAQPSDPERAPKLSVDPKGGVTVEGGGERDEEGSNWEEVVLMLDRLQEKIKAKRLAGLGDD